MLRVTSVHVQCNQRAFQKAPDHMLQHVSKVCILAAEVLKSISLDEKGPA